MSGLIWFQTVCYSNGISDFFPEKSDFEKSVDDKKHEKLPSRQRVYVKILTQFAPKLPLQNMTDRNTEISRYLKAIHIIPVSLLP